MEESKELVKEESKELDRGLREILTYTRADTAFIIANYT